MNKTEFVKLIRNRQGQVIGKRVFDSKGKTIFRKKIHPLDLGSNLGSEILYRRSDFS